MNRTLIASMATAFLVTAAGCTTVPPASSGSTGGVGGTTATTQQPVMSMANAARPLLDMVPEINSPEARAKAHVDLGTAYFEIGKYDVALDEARIALQSESRYAPAAYHLMGLVYMFLNDNAAANTNFQRALQAAPSDPDFNNSYGWFQCVNGQAQEGLQRLMTAAHNPYYRYPTRPYTNAGLCFVRQNDFENAKSQFQRAVGEDPENGKALYQLADIAYKQGDLTATRNFLVQLHQRREPTPESIWLGLRTAKKLGHREEADSYMAQLRGRFEDSPEHEAMTQGRYE